MSWLRQDCSCWRILSRNHSAEFCLRQPALADDGRCGPTMPADGRCVVLPGGIAMSLHPQVVYLVPEETARVARAAFPKGNVSMQLYDARGLIYENHQFATLFPRRGQPAADPARLALILGMQF